jgi:hypothetical protein
LYNIKITEIKKTTGNKMIPGEYVTRNIFEQNVEKLNILGLLEVINKGNKVIDFDKNFSLAR